MLTRWMQATAVAALVLGLAVVLAGSPVVTAQIATPHGQNIAPAFEGWQENEDGSFNLLFGYFNRNWAEELHIPIGPDNNIEPGGADYGQPTWFYPRRNRFVFKVRVPADFGEKELVWTLTSNGVTERAYGSLLIDYYTDDTVIQNNKGAGGGGGGMYDLAGNKPPELRVDGPQTREVRVGQPLQLAAYATDDGIPEPRPFAEHSVQVPQYARQRLGPVAVVDRLPRRGGRREVQSRADLRLGGHARRRQFAVGVRLGRPGRPGQQPLGSLGDVQRARHLRHPRLGRRRRTDELRGHHGPRDRVDSLSLTAART